MSADPFNSAGGYSVGIPPVSVIDSNGNLTIDTANIGNLTVSGTIFGNLVGDIGGNITVSTPNTSILFTNNDTMDGSISFVYDTANNKVVIDNELVIGNTLTYGLGSFTSVKAVTGSTIDNSVEQILYSVGSANICSMEYTIIGTDSTANARQTTKLFSSVLGSEVDYFEYGTIDINGGVGDFKTQYNLGTNTVDLTVSPYRNNQIDYKILITTYKQ